MPFSLYTWTVILFLLAMGVYFFYDRKNFERQGITFLRKTQKGQKFINSQAKKHPVFWRWYSNIASVVAYPLMLGSFVLIAYLGIDFMFFAEPGTQAPVGLVLPSFTQETVIGNGFFLVPFWFWIIGIFILAVVHELAHGIIARNEKVKVKSLGFAFLGPIVAAFVEPDDEQMFRKGWKTVARIASVGAFTNFIFGILFFGAFLGLDATAYTQTGLVVTSVPGGPLNQTGISTAIITQLDNQDITSFSDLRGFLENKSPGDEVKITLNEINSSSFDIKEQKEVTVTLHENEEREGDAFIGVFVIQGDYKIEDNKIVQRFGLSFTNHGEVKDAKVLPGLTNFFRNLFFWLVLLNIFIGLANLIPAGPLDGGLIWKATLQDNLGKVGEKILKGTNWTMGLILLGMFITLALQWIGFPPLNLAGLFLIYLISFLRLFIL